MIYEHTNFIEYSSGPDFENSEEKFDKSQLSLCSHKNISIKLFLKLILFEGDFRIKFPLNIYENFWEVSLI